jgi:hypothetical protein
MEHLEHYPHVKRNITQLPCSNMLELVNLWFLLSRNATLGTGFVTYSAKEIRHATLR